MVSSRAASAASFLFAKGSITLRQPFLEKFGGSRPNCDESCAEAPPGAVPAFMMLPQLWPLPVQDWLSSHSWIWFRDASPLELSEEWIAPEESGPGIELA